MSKKPEMEPLIIISLMSGTSCDSIDVGLCQVFPDFSCKLLDGFNYKYPDEVKERIFNILLKGADLPEICKMNFIIGHCFAQGAKLMSEKHKEKKNRFHFIAWSNNISLSIQHKICKY
jgi:1,6-anhydro-N-acetylmuramate kinase